MARNEDKGIQKISRRALSMQQIGQSIPISTKGEGALLVNLSIDDDEAGPIGVTLTLPDIRVTSADPEFARIFRIIREQESYVALIEWGSGMLSSAVEIDFINGAGLTVVGSSLRVTAYRENFDVSPLLTVGAFAGIGLAGSRRPQRTRYLKALGAGANSGMPIPPFAKSFKVLRDTGVGFSLDLTIQLRQNVTGTPIETILLGANSLCPEIPISNDARQVRIFNTAAFAQNVTVVFEIDL